MKTIIFAGILSIAAWSGVFCSDAPVVTGLAFLVIFAFISVLIDKIRDKMIEHIPPGDNRSVWQVKVLGRLRMLSKSCLFAAASLGAGYAYLFYQGTLF